MKLKNINFVERHFEKFIILLALCVLGYALLNWGLSTPYKAELGGQEVTAGRVDEVLQQHTQRLKDTLSGDEVHDQLKNLKVQDVVSLMAAETRKPLMHKEGNPDQALAILDIPAGVPGPGEFGTGPEVADDDYYEPKVPTPTIVHLDAKLRTIHPDEFLNNPDLETEFVNARTPDLAEITVAGQFNMLEWITELMTQPENTDQALPEDWWITRNEIVVVEMWRRTQMADGSWGQPEKVSTIPGAIAAEAQRVPEELDPSDPRFADLSPLVKWIQTNRASIIQPPFLETIGEPWNVPRKLTEEELRVAGEAGKIKLKIQELQSQLNQRIKQIQKLQSLGQPNDGGGTAPGTIGLPGEFGGERPGGTTRPRPRPGGNAAANARAKQIERWTKLAEKTQAQIAELQAEYQDLTGSVVEQEQPNRLDPTLTPGGFPGEFEGEFGPGGFPPSGLDPRTRGYDPRTPRIDPRTGRQIDPRTGRQIDPLGGRTTPRIDPRTGRQIDPRTGRQIAPGDLLGGEGVDGEGDEGAADTPEARAKRLAVVMGGEQIDIWQSDLNVEPGKTYQYRFVVKVMNPLYAKPLLPGSVEEKDSQKARHHKRFLLVSKPSEWTEAVTVPQMTQLFVHGATPNPRPGQVTFHVYRFSWGEWRMQEFTVRPGDPIGGVKEIDDQALPSVVEVDFSTGKYCLDVDFDFKIKAGGGLVDKRVPRVLVVDGPEVTAHRQDLDRENEKQWNTDRALEGEFAGPAGGRETASRR